MSDLLEKMGNIKTSIPNKDEDTFLGKVKSDLKENKINQRGTKLKKSELFLEKLRNSNFNLDEMEDVIKTDGNQLIIAGAGSGKTTALLCKIQYNILTGELSKKYEINGNLVPIMANVLVCTFLKSGAVELKERMSKLQSSLGLQKTAHMLNFSTLHAEFYKILRELGYSMGVISEKENMSLLKKVLKANDIKINGKMLNSNQLDDFSTALYFTRSRLDEKRYSPEIYLECGIGPREVDALIADWGKLRVLDNKIDFSDMEEILYNACYVQQKENVINHIASKYDYIYIDEFQDTSQVQYKMIKILAMGCKKVVVIGDDDQTIYSWRGSDVNIITNDFKDDFDCQVSKLTYNFRCPSNILTPVISSIERNTNRVDKSLKSFNEGGVLKVKYFNTLSEASSYLSKISYDSLKDKKDVTVICRTNMDGLIPALTFENMGRFNFSISSNSMTLDNYIGRLILRIGKLFYSHDQRIIKSVISSMSWEEGYKIGAMAKYCSENKITVFETEDEDLKYSLPEICNVLIQWKHYLREEGEIVTFRRILEYFGYNVFRKNNSFNNTCREVIKAVIFILESNKFTKVREVVDYIYNLNNSLVSRIGIKNARVKIVTVHEFKGKESDVVVLWNDSKGVFPPSDEISLEDFEEERRVHYIACTRAIQELHILTNKNKHSYFFDELDLRNAEVV